jgi:methionine sulfoxide reductase heme-binding subunit
MIVAQAVAAQTAPVPVAWLVARAAGLVTLALLTVSVTLGLALSTRVLGNRRGKVLIGWHQTLTWTALAMLGLHMGALVLDPTIHFGIVGVLVPGAAPWRPVPVAAGILTGWLMLALAVSFHVRRRIGQRRWRLLHYTTFAAFTIGVYHALNVGTDFTGTRGLILAGIVIAPVAWLTYARILMPRAQARQAPTPRTTASPTALATVKPPPEQRRVAVPT